MKQSASQDTKRPNLQRYFFTSSIYACAVHSSVPSVTDTQVATTKIKQPVHVDPKINIYRPLFYTARTHNLHIFNSEYIRVCLLLLQTIPQSYIFCRNFPDFHPQDYNNDL